MCIKRFCLLCCWNFCKSIITCLKKFRPFSYDERQCSYGLAKHTNMADAYMYLQYLKYNTIFDQCQLPIDSKASEAIEKCIILPVSFFDQIDLHVSF